MKLHVTLLLAALTTAVWGAKPLTKNELLSIYAREIEEKWGKRCDCGPCQPPNCGSCCD